MLPRKIQDIFGWGRFPVIKSITYRPEKQSDIQEIYRTHRPATITRGQGKSYGDAGLNSKGVIDMQRLDRFLLFDTDNGIMRTQAGVTLADIMDITIPKGWMPPILPGTQFASIGGCVACNVHGKNHFKDGDIASHIVDIKLRLTSGEEAHCSPEENSDLFWATAGGMGMTGCIEEVTLKLRPIKSTSLRTWTHKVHSIEDMVACFRENEKDSDYMVGWIDHFAKGDSVGRGIFEKAIHIDENSGSPCASYKPNRDVISIPKWFPSFLMNRYTMLLYNIIRFGNYSDKPKEEIQDFAGFFHPLDNLKNWNRLYGKKGFLQYQCVVPEGLHAAEQLHHILKMIQDSGLFSYLAVIKYHREHKGLLSFPVNGFSLALDFPNRPLVHELLNRVDDYLCGIGGRVYLAKDARLRPDMFHKMYGQELEKWQKIIKLADPKEKLRSAMSTRLKFRGK